MCYSYYNLGSRTDNIGFLLLLLVVIHAWLSAAGTVGALGGQWLSAAGTVGALGWQCSAAWLSAAGTVAALGWQCSAAWLSAAGTVGALGWQWLSAAGTVEALGWQCSAICHIKSVRGCSYRQVVTAEVFVAGWAVVCSPCLIVLAMTVMTLQHLLWPEINKSTRLKIQYGPTWTPSLVSRQSSYSTALP